MSKKKLEPTPVKNVTVIVGNPIYLIPLIWIVGDYDYYRKVLSKKFGLPKEKEQKYFGGETMLISDDKTREACISIWIPEISFTCANYDSVVHELSHAVWHIFSAAGVKVDGDNQEPFSYLLGYFFSETLDKFQKLYTKVNPK